MSKNDKKLGSMKDIKRKEKDKPFIDKFWEYKPYMLIGLVVILIIVIYSFSLNKTSRSESVQTRTPAAASPSLVPAGKLVVVTRPPEALVQFNGQVKHSPVVFEKVPEGKHIAIISYHGYQTEQKEVAIEKNKTTKLDVTLTK
jgi:hypothetical protein